MGSFLKDFNQAVEDPAFVLSEFFCGPKSRLCQMLSGNIPSRMMELESVWAGVRMTLGAVELNGYIGQQAVRLLEGICKCYRASQIVGPDSINDRADAIHAFNEAWPAAHSDRTRSIGEMIADYLISTWSSSAVPENEQPKIIGTSRTLVLLANPMANTGSVTELHVELSEVPANKAGIFPDPTKFGCTLFPRGVQGQAPFLDSMHQVWKHSGLAERYQARWWLLPLEHVAADIWPATLVGDSAEVAMLCALLAATGDPYLRGGEPSRWDLAEGIAATGRVRFEDIKPGTKLTREDVLKLDLGRVGGLKQKQDAAKKAQLHQMLVSSDQDELKAKGRSEKNLLQPVTTVGGALHNLLARNQIWRNLAKFRSNNFQGQWYIDKDSEFDWGLGEQKARDPERKGDYQVSK